MELCQQAGNYEQLCDVARKESACWDSPPASSNGDGHDVDPGVFSGSGRRQRRRWALRSRRPAAELVRLGGIIHTKPGSPDVVEVRLNGRPLANDDLRWLTPL